VAHSGIRMSASFGQCIFTLVRDVVRGVLILDSSLDSAGLQQISEVYVCAAKLGVR